MRLPLVLGITLLATFASAQTPRPGARPNVSAPLPAEPRRLPTQPLPMTEIERIPRCLDDDGAPSAAARGILRDGRQPMLLQSPTELVFDPGLLALPSDQRATLFRLVREGGEGPGTLPTFWLREATLDADDGMLRLERGAGGFVLTVEKPGETWLKDAQVFNCRFGFGDLWRQAQRLALPVWNATKPPRSIIDLRQERHALPEDQRALVRRNAGRAPIELAGFPDLVGGEPRRLSVRSFLDRPIPWDAAVNAIPLLAGTQRYDLRVCSEEPPATRTGTDFPCLTLASAQVDPDEPLTIRIASDNVLFPMNLERRVVDFRQGVPLALATVMRQPRIPGEAEITYRGTRTTVFPPGLVALYGEPTWERSVVFLGLVPAIGTPSAGRCPTFDRAQAQEWRVFEQSPTTVTDAQVCAYVLAPVPAGQSYLATDAAAERRAAAAAGLHGTTVDVVVGDRTIPVNGLATNGTVPITLPRPLPAERFELRVRRGDVTATVQSGVLRIVPSVQPAPGSPTILQSRKLQRAELEAEIGRLRLHSAGGAALNQAETGAVLTADEGRQLIARFVSAQGEPTTLVPRIDPEGFAWLQETMQQQAFAAQPVTLRIRHGAMPIGPPIELQGPAQVAFHDTRIVRSTRDAPLTRPLPRDWAHLEIARVCVTTPVDLGAEFEQVIPIVATDDTGLEVGRFGSSLPARWVREGEATASEQLYCARVGTRAMSFTQLRPPARTAGRVFVHRPGQACTAGGTSCGEVALSPLELLVGLDAVREAHVGVAVGWVNGIGGRAEVLNEWRGYVAVPGVQASMQLTPNVSVAADAGALLVFGSGAIESDGGRARFAAGPGVYAGACGGFDLPRSWGAATIRLCGGASVDLKFGAVTKFGLPRADTDPGVWLDFVPYLGLEALRWE